MIKKQGMKKIQKDKYNILKKGYFSIVNIY